MDYKSDRVVIDGGGITDQELTKLLGGRHPSTRQRVEGLARAILGTLQQGIAKQEVVEACITVQRHLIQELSMQDRLDVVKDMEECLLAEGPEGRG